MVATSACRPLATDNACLLAAMRLLDGDGVRVLAFNAQRTSGCNLYKNHALHHMRHLTAQCFAPPRLPQSQHWLPGCGLIIATAC